MRMQNMDGVWEKWACARVQSTFNFYIVQCLWLVLNVRSLLTHRINKRTHSIKQGESYRTVCMCQCDGILVFSKNFPNWLPWRHAIDSDVIHPARSIPFRSVQYIFKHENDLASQMRDEWARRTKKTNNLTLTHTPHSSLAFAHHSPELHANACTVQRVQLI